MELTNKQVEVRILKPKDGFVLTQSDDAIENMQRCFFKVIVLAPSDSPENYKEITIEEAETLKAEQEKLIEEHLKDSKQSLTED